MTNDDRSQNVSISSVSRSLFVEIIQLWLISLDPTSTIDSLSREDLDGLNSTDGGLVTRGKGGDGCMTWGGTEGLGGSGEPVEWAGGEREGSGGSGKEGSGEKRGTTFGPHRLWGMVDSDYNHIRYQTSPPHLHRPRLHPH